MSDHRPITPEKKQALKKRFSKFNKYSSGHHDVRDEADPEMRRLYIFLDRWQRIEKFRDEVRDIEQRIPGTRFDFDSGGRSIFRSEYMTEDQASLHFEMAAEAKGRWDRKQSERYRRQKRRKYERKLEQQRLEGEARNRELDQEVQARIGREQWESMTAEEQAKARDEQHEIDYEQMCAKIRKRDEESQNRPRKIRRKRKRDPEKERARRQRRRDAIYHSNGN